MGWLLVPWAQSERTADGGDIVIGPWLIGGCWR